MMCRVSLIAARDDGHPAFLCADIVKIPSEQSRTRMVTITRSNPKADYKRPRQNQHIFLQILNRLQDISLTVAWHSGWYLVIVPQVGFRLFQLYNRNLAVRRCTYETAILNRAPGCQARHYAPMAVCICTWHNREWVIARKRLINHLIGVFRSILEPLRRNTSLNCLIPNTYNAASSCKITKNRLLITNSRINKTYRDIFSGKAKRLPLCCQDSRLRQTQRIERRVLRSLQILCRDAFHQPIAFWCEGVCPLSKSVVLCTVPVYV